jgi:hypothetical protein
MSTRMGLWPDGFVEGHDFSHAVKARRVCGKGKTSVVPLKGFSAAALAGGGWLRVLLTAKLGDQIFPVVQRDFVYVVQSESVSRKSKPHRQQEDQYFLPRI